MSEKFIKNGRNIPADLVAFPDEYHKRAEHEGRLVRLEYETWEALTYEQHKKG